MLRALFVVLLLSACAAPRIDPGRPATYALTTPGVTTLGRMVPPRDGLSGFRLVTSGREALALALALIGAAERTLDLQYYAWRADETGRLVLAHVLAAAERGVRVRVLVDDLEAPAGDVELGLLGQHPNLEIRLFNPFPLRQARRLNLLFDLGRMTHRMHNKAMVADNALALVGGRNIGDQYATLSEDRPNYRDLDLLAAGPVVREISATFDAFWNSPWSLRPSVFADPPPVRPVVPAVAPVALPEFSFIWAPARVLADEPDKPLTGTSQLFEDMAAAVGPVGRELLIETAYLIPGEAEVAGLCGLVAAGLRVRILTNSLASVDSVAAGAAYLPYRKPLVACGAELYEMKPRPSFAPRSPISLHTKAVVFDRRWVVVGSFNLDHRSRDLNTELALLIESPDLARSVAAFIHRGMAPGNAWRLSLVGDDLVWEGAEGVEPQANFWRKLNAVVLSVLPEEQL